VVREAGAVNLLLDSHALLWSLHDPGRLAATAREVISDPRAVVYYSAASVWELELKAAKGKLTLPTDWLDATAALRFVELPVTARDARRSAELPWHHSDPFDRLLVAQAQLSGVRLASRDPLVAVYDVAVLLV
jgi:PIN domain nuclease of toxin-antitoxin system